MSKAQSLVESYKSALSQWPIGCFYAREHDHRDVSAIERMADIVLADDPENLSAAYIKASILLTEDGHQDVTKEKYIEATKLLRPIIESQESDKNLISDFAHALYYSGEYQEAVPYLRKLRDYFPSDDSSQIMLCYALFKSEQKAEALTMFKTVIDDLPELMNYYSDEITEMVRAGHNIISKLAPSPSS